VIEINLLPGSRKKRGGKGGGFQMPDFKALVTSVKDPWLIACAVGWLLVAAMTAGVWMPRRAALKAKEPELAAAQRDAAHYKAVLKTKAESEAKRDTLLAQINVIRDIDRERYVWPHILDAVTKSLPPYTWLDDITSRTTEGDSTGAPGSVSFQVSGKSADIQAITRFVRDMEESPFLENATQVSTAVVSEQNRDVFSFVLNVKYQQPDTLLLTLQPLAATLVQGYRSGAVRPAAGR
jgi:Tfp pilus assembly protein PilN